MRGRKPKPKADPKANGKPPPPPEELDDLAAEEWVRVAALLVARRVLMPDDHAALYVYCSSWSQYVRAGRHIDQNGLVNETEDGAFVKNPSVTVQNSAANRMRPLLSELGLTPAARARLKPADDDADDLLD